MPLASKRPANTEQSKISVVSLLASRTQLDFELGFFNDILERMPDYVDVLRAQSANSTLKGLQREGLRVDQTLTELLPDDPDIRYNLACRYAMMRQPDLAIEQLQWAVSLGYHDFTFMIQDRDLDSLRNDPRFRQLIRSFAER